MYGIVRLFVHISMQLYWLIPKDILNEEKEQLTGWHGFHTQQKLKYFTVHLHFYRS